VLGAGAVRPNRGGACSGYLVQSKGTNVLVDCGFGVLSRLVDTGALDALTAIVVTHSHPDHCADLVGVHMALRYGLTPCGDRIVPVYAGPGVVEELSGLGDPYGEDLAEGPLRFSRADPATSTPIGAFGLRLAPTTHVRRCFAVRLDALGRSVVFTGDTGPSADVARLASGTDLLVAESTLGPRRCGQDGAGHLSAEGAGRLAADAGAGRLLLTHFYVEHGPDSLVAAARSFCSCHVGVAMEGAVHDV
jgi:ribonuclease BN (tRNA processing enzyme)